VTDGVPAILSAPAKLTLSLRVVGVRGDGLHRIDAEMVTVDLTDTLRLGDGDGVTFVGPHAEGLESGDDLVTRALALVGATARVEVDKHIPPGTGLGGGSADAAAILRWFGFDDVEAAARLGADVPFCVLGGRARVTGIGEVLQPLPHEERTFTLLTPPRHCATAAVYQAWDDLGGPEGPNGNDLEPAALAVLPELARWRDELEEAAGGVPKLAGSGSTWFVEGSFPGVARRVVHTLGPPLRSDRRPIGES
jgi:4-diphosphocytidyl-2-C-methyl-D-erythritol kinase